MLSLTLVMCMIFLAVSFDMSTMKTRVSVVSRSSFSPMSMKLYDWKKRKEFKNLKIPDGTVVFNLLFMWNILKVQIDCLFLQIMCWRRIPYFLFLAHDEDLRESVGEFRQDKVDLVAKG